MYWKYWNSKASRTRSANRAKSHISTRWVGCAVEQEVIENSLEMWQLGHLVKETEWRLSLALGLLYLDVMSGKDRYHRFGQVWPMGDSLKVISP